MAVAKLDRRSKVAKRFFFACAGLFLLALSYHLGASTATAQAGSPSIVGVAWRLADGHAYAAASDGSIFATPGYCAAWTRVGQLPAGEVPTEVLDGDVGGSMDVMCASGNAYTVTGSFPSIGLVLCSSIYSSPTPATRSTWGNLKARYR